MSLPSPFDRDDPVGLVRVRVDVDGLRNTVLSAMAHKHGEIIPMLQAAVDKALSPENVQAEIDKLVEATVSSVIKEEVSSFFRYGPGREVLKEATVKRLNQRFELPGDPTHEG